MPTAEGCAGRRRRLWDALPSPCDALVINDPRHLTYFPPTVASKKSKLAWMAFRLPALVSAGVLPMKL